MNESPNLEPEDQPTLSAEEPAGAPNQGPSSLPAEIDMEKSTVSEAASSLLNIFNYSASLPERTLRSATALAGGLVHETANWLIPSAFRNSKSYSIFVQQMLDFVVKDIGGVKKNPSTV